MLALSESCCPPRSQGSTRISGWNHFFKIIPQVLITICVDLVCIPSLASTNCGDRLSNLPKKEDHTLPLTSTPVFTGAYTLSYCDYFSLCLIPVNCEYIQLPGPCINTLADKKGKT